MARTPKNASIEVVATTELTTLGGYAVPVSTTSTAYLVLTNTTSTVLDISVYINNGTSNFLLVKSKVAGGVGKNWIVGELPTQKLNAGFTIKVQATTPDAFNAFLSVSEISNN